MQDSPLFVLFFILVVLLVQGIENISVQSSVSLQHLPYDKELEKNVKASIADRLSFATQKLAEIVKAAKDAPTLKDDQIKAGLPDVGMPLLCSPAPAIVQFRVQQFIACEALCTGDTSSTFTLERSFRPVPTLHSQMRQRQTLLQNHKQQDCDNVVVFTVDCTFAGNPLSSIDKGMFSRSAKFADRITQQIKTHAFPTSSIGSFPQTPGKNCPAHIACPGCGCLLCCVAWQACKA